jgi:S-adenosylmethionine hydrolase
VSTGHFRRPPGQSPSGLRATPQAASHRFITFLTDFGLEDDFVGTCRGVIKMIAPEVELIDITHGIEPQGVLQGALVLANTLPYMPAGVHLAVVDPEVGAERKALVLQGNGRLFVGPDNGLLLVAAEKLGGVQAAVEIANRDYLLEPVSRTFHGRDVFSPVAAHLALGVPIDEFGPRVEPASLRRLDVPKPAVGTSRLRVTVLYVDRYGNVQVNATTEELEAAGMQPGSQVEIDVGFESYFAFVATTFADVRPGDILVYEDSYRNVALAINGGNAAEMLSARPGQELRIRLAD